MIDYIINILKGIFKKENKDYVLEEKSVERKPKGLNPKEKKKTAKKPKASPPKEKKKKTRPRKQGNMS